MRTWVFLHQTLVFAHLRSCSFSFDSDRDPHPQASRTCLFFSHATLTTLRAETGKLSGADYCARIWQEWSSGARRVLLPSGMNFEQRRSWPRSSYPWFDCITRHDKEKGGQYEQPQGRRDGIEGKAVRAVDVVLHKGECECGRSPDADTCCCGRSPPPPLSFLPVREVSERVPIKIYDRTLCDRG